MEFTINPGVCAAFPAGTLRDHPLHTVIRAPDPAGATTITAASPTIRLWSRIRTAAIPTARDRNTAEVSLRTAKSPIPSGLADQIKGGVILQARRYVDSKRILSPSTTVAVSGFVSSWWRQVSSVVSGPFVSEQLNAEATKTVHSIQCFT